MEKNLNKEENKLVNSSSGRVSSNVLRKKKQVRMNIVIFLLGMITGIVMTFIVFDKGNIFDINNYDDKKTEQVSGTMKDLLNEEEYIIDTPILNLSYPKKWMNFIYVEQKEGDIYTVEFYARFEGKEDIHIFDILFGGDDGFNLGYLVAEHDSNIPVNVVSYNINFSENWSDDEKNIVYSMAEDVNFTIGMLQNVDGFVQVS